MNGSSRRRGSGISRSGWRGKFSPGICIFLLCLWLTAPGYAVTQQFPEMIKDLEPGIRTTDRSSNPTNPVLLGSDLFFLASAYGGPTRIFRLDLASLSCEEIPGEYPAPSQLKAFSDGLLFTSNSIGKPHLWRLDPGNLPVFQDLLSSATYSINLTETLLGEDLFFTASNSSKGLELWKTNGTSSGTLRVKEIAASLTGYVPISAMKATTERIFFWVGTSLWATDGTASNTTNVFSDPHSGARFSYVVQDSLVFWLSNSYSGSSLWRSDGTTTGTKLLKQVHPRSSASSPSAQLKGIVYFSVKDDAGKSFGTWRSDGTPEGTLPYSPSLYGNCFSTGESIFCLREGGSAGSDTELWRIDGSTSAEEQVRILSGSPYLTGYSMSSAGNYVFFSSRTGQSDVLWRTDGTASETLQVGILPSLGSRYPVSLSLTGTAQSMFVYKNVAGTFGQLWWCEANGENFRQAKGPGFINGLGCSGLSPIGDRVFFSGSENVHGAEPWISDGTESGTALIADLGWETGSSYPHAIRDLGGKAMLFSASAYGDSYGNLRKLWRSDGTAEGTVTFDNTLPPYYSIVFDNPNSQYSNSSYNQQPFVVGNTLYYIAGPPNSNYELWKSDGTPGGTRLVKNGFAEDSKLGSPVFFGADNRLCFFTDINKPGLWVSDGTSSGTTKINDKILVPANVQREDCPFGIINNDITYFAASNGASGEALWRTDGTAAGTWIVREVLGSTSHFCPQMTLLNDWIYFGVRIGTENSLWKTNGQHNFVFDVSTFTSTVLPGGVDLSSNYSAIGPIASTSENVFFTINGKKADESQLWVTGGDAGSTRFLQTVGLAHHFVPVGKNLFFLAESADMAVRRFWKSDGTAGGTRIIAEVRGRQRYYKYCPLVLSSGSFFFAAADESGDELCQSDGTADGTHKWDIFPGPTGSLPSSLANVGGKLFFSANDGIHGIELWACFSKQITQSTGWDLYR